MQMRNLAGCTAVVVACWLSHTPAQAQSALAQTPAARPAPRQLTTQEAFRERVNQNTVTIISGNPNGGFLGIAYDISAAIDDGDDMRVLPVVGKGGWHNVRDVLHLRGIDMVPVNQQLTHVADVEQAGILAGPEMLGHDALVLYGHFIVGEGHHPRALAAVPLVQRKLLQWRFLEPGPALRVAAVRRAAGLGLVRLAVMYFLAHPHAPARLRRPTPARTSWPPPPSVRGA